MITLTRLNGTTFVLNDDLIETIQQNPDTTIRLTTGNIYIVKETAEEVVVAARHYRRGLYTNLPGRDDL